MPLVVRWIAVEVRSATQKLQELTSGWVFLKREVLFFKTAVLPEGIFQDCGILEDGSFCKELVERVFDWTIAMMRKRSKELGLQKWQCSWHN